MHNLLFKICWRLFYSPKKLNNFKIISSFYLYQNIILLIFWVCLIDIIPLWMVHIFQNYYVIIDMFFYIYIYIYSAIKLFKLFKFLIFLKEIIMIIKNHNKIALNITQIIDRQIQMYIDNIFLNLFYINSNSHF